MVTEQQRLQMLQLLAVAEHTPGMKEKIKAMYEAQTGNKITTEALNQAFDFLKDKKGV